MNPLRYLLDTNIISDLVRHPAGIVRDRIAEAGEESVCVNIVVAAELRFGAAKRKSKRLSRQIEAILSALPVLALESPVDVHYAEIRATLEAAGNSIGPNDLLIAAHARALGLTLVTHNLAEFSRVPGLSVEDWLAVG
jgi:tRNA(fMet)-specific endonuclease VapC